MTCKDCTTHAKHMRDKPCEDLCPFRYYMLHRVQYQGQLELAQQKYHISICEETAKRAILLSVHFNTLM